jgi:hypothetical protein
MIIERPHEAGGRPYQSIWPDPQVFFLKPAADQNGGYIVQATRTESLLSVINT